MASIVTTGASSGIGAAAAVELSRRGHRVLATGRSAQRLAAVHAAMCAVVPPATDVPAPVTADLSSLAQVRELAARVLELSPDLSVLVNNAGVQPHRRQETPDGFELTFAVNHLAPFLLTKLLTEALQRNGGRVITTSSSTHTAGTLDFDDLQMTRDWSTRAAYGRSKLANILFTRELSARTGLPASSFHPGAVRTDINRDSPFVRLVKPFERLLLDSPERGADTLVWLADGPVGAAPQAVYYANCRPAETTAAACDEAAAAKLWEVSDALTSGEPHAGGRTTLGLPARGD